MGLSAGPGVLGLRQAHHTDGVGGQIAVVEKPRAGGPAVARSRAGGGGGGRGLG